MSYFSGEPVVNMVGAGRGGEWWRGLEGMLGNFYKGEARRRLEGKLGRVL